MAITEGQLEKRGKYWHWRYSVDGQRKKKSLKVTKLAEAKRLRQAYIAEYNNDPARYSQAEKNPTVEEFWEQYEPWSRDHKRRSTLDVEVGAWTTLLNFSGVKRVGDVTPDSTVTSIFHATSS